MSASKINSIDGYASGINTLLWRLRMVYLLCRSLAEYKRAIANMETNGEFGGMHK